MQTTTGLTEKEQRRLDQRELLDAISMRVDSLIEDHPSVRGQHFLPERLYRGVAFCCGEATGEGTFPGSGSGMYQATTLFMEHVHRPISQFVEGSSHREAEYHYLMRMQAERHHRIAFSRIFNPFDITSS